MKKANAGDYRNSRVLVTGGAGAIGSNLARALSGCAESVVALDNLESGFEENISGLKGVEFVKADINDEKALDRAFGRRVDVVFHLAARFANQNSVDNPLEDLATNGTGMLRLLRKCSQHGIKRFVYASSSCVYGSNQGVLREDMPRGALDTPYAITKLLGEHYVEFFNRHHKMDTVILRYFNSYGPGEYPGKYRNVIPNFFKLAINRKPLTITGTGNETRDFTFVEDTVAGTLAAGTAKSAIGETINIASGRETKIMELAEKINAICGNCAGVKFAERRQWDSITHRGASIEKAKRLLGYAPKTSLDEGLKKTYEWFVGRGIK